MKKVYAMLLICAFLLGGCSSNSSDILAMPEMPQMQRELIETVDSVRGGGYEYSEPRSGLNRQPLQLMDLDGDGEEEGIAFLRDVTETYKTFIYIFEKTTRGFVLFDIIEGSENELYTVSYSDILGKSGYELIVEWGDNGSGSHPITIYNINRDGLEKILEISAKEYSVSDLDNDGTNEFIAVAKRGVGLLADIYVSDSGKGLIEAASVPLSTADGELLRIKAAEIMPSKNGVVIERKAETGVVTDVVAHNGERFVNMLPEGELCSGEATAADVDGDGIIEMPKSAANGLTSSVAANRFFRWNVLSGENSLRQSSFTYHSYPEGWYLLMPLAWSGSVVAERSATRSGEVAIRFLTREYMHGDTEEFVEAPLFSIYVLTGNQREQHAAEEGRFVVSTREGTIFAAEVISESYLATEINEELIKEMFKDIENDWFSEILFA
ncbi:MAG: hypothetical protein IJP38_05910 [Oscillospiraceae bacterium]|nr:hypothetical protein [Oscillospiraceae bacterium]